MWDTIEVRMPTVSERIEMARSLAQSVYAETGEWPVVSVQPDHQPSSHRVTRVFGEPVDGDWMLHLEGDVRLAHTFADTVPRVLASCDYVAVAFFDTAEHENGLETANKPFYWMQCVAVRARYVEGFVPFYQRWLTAHDEHHDAVDLAFGDYMTECGEPVGRYYPSQVQHRPVASTLGGRSTQRQSPTFPGGIGHG